MSIISLQQAVFYSEIERIRSGPAMFLGRTSLTALSDFMNGFQSALIHTLGIDRPEKLLPLDFWFFHEYVARHYHWTSSEAGWRNIILKENGGDEEKSLWAFYDLLDDFKDLSIERCYLAALSEGHVYMIELTHNAGWLCMVNTELRYQLKRRIFEKRDDIEAYMKLCFGSPLDWKSVEMKNIEFKKECSLF